MLFDDIAKKSDSFLNIWVIEFLKLFDENIEHRNSNFSLLGIMGVDILVCFFGLFLFGVIIEKSNFLFDYVFNEHEQSGKNSWEILSEFLTVDEAKSLPTSKDIGFLRISLLKLRALEVNHQLNKLSSSGFEEFRAYRASYDS